MEQESSQRRETGFLKKGDESAGVAKQYYGLTGQIENCQVVVFLAYISSRGQSLINRRLYLPKSWSSSSEKRKKAVRSHAEVDSAWERAPR